MPRQIIAALSGLFGVCASTHLLIDLFCHFFYHIVDVHVPTPLLFILFGARLLTEHLSVKRPVIDHPARGIVGDDILVL